MANNGSLQQIFEKPLPENPSLIELLEHQIKSIKPPEDPFCFEMFGELHFKEISQSSSSPSKINGDGFLSGNSESLQHCTERLGFESTNDDFEESKNESEVDWKNHEMVKDKKVSITKYNLKELIRESETIRSKSFPPLIPSLGRNGKPRFCYKSYRHEGRLIIKEFKIPTQEVFLHASRENGTLTLGFIQSNKEISEDGEEEEDGLKKIMPMKEKRSE